MTYKERLERGLGVLGFRQEQSTTRKYTTWGKPGHKDKFFVGPAGALRLGPCASQSHSVGAPQLESREYRAVLGACDKARRCVGCPCYFLPKNLEQWACDDCTAMRLAAAEAMQPDSIKFAENPDL
ncbi:MAG TPA: hypothetical protein VNU68_21280 [Verrucomicrobiae bacterium]|nr:hypothetical protein [Verrucomicrobiae bacterium]